MRCSPTAPPVDFLDCFTVGWMPGQVFYVVSGGASNVSVSWAAVPSVRDSDNSHLVITGSASLDRFVPSAAAYGSHCVDEDERTVFIAAGDSVYRFAWPPR